MLYFVTAQSGPRIYCDTAGVPWQVREKKVEQPRPGALSMRRKEPAPGLVTVKELVTEQLLYLFSVLRQNCQALGNIFEAYGSSSFASSMPRIPHEMTSPAPTVSIMDHMGRFTP